MKKINITDWIEVVYIDKRGFMQFIFADCRATILKRIKKMKIKPDVFWSDKDHVTISHQYAKGS